MEVKRVKNLLRVYEFWQLQFLKHCKDGSTVFTLLLNIISFVALVIWADLHIFHALLAASNLSSIS